MSPSRLTPQSASRLTSSTGCADVSAGLVSLWQAEGSTADVTGANNGIAEGSLAYAPGMSGQAFSFNGSNAYVFVPTSATMPAASASRTWTFWMYTRPTSWPGDYHTPFHSGGQEFTRAFSLDFADYPFLQFYTWSYDVGFDSGLPVEGWAHVAMTYDGWQAFVYINGQQRAELDGDLNTDASFGAKFGGFPEFVGGPSFFDGLIDDAALYNRALTPAEVQAIYNAGSAGLCNPANATSLTQSSIALVSSLLSGGQIDASTAQALTVTLNEVLAGIQSGAPATSLKGKLGAADNKVDAALKSKKITSAVADQLHGAIAGIRGHL